jgi:NAD-dependent deacetylase
VTGTEHEEELRFAAGAIADADTAVAMTGAGVSTASGVPDFRGPDGLWERYDVEDFHVSRFERDPAGFWRDRLGMVEELYGDGVEPNAAHEALAGMERDGRLTAVLTQNVDGLHGRAGSEEVIELHGNGSRVVCRGCGRRSSAGTARKRAREGELPPRCRSCDGVLKPDVTLFGESLPEHAVYRGHALAQQADTFLVAGSSLTVEPAAGLPREAAERGATLVLVNLERTPLSDRAEYDFRADVTELLPRLAAAVEAY